MKKRVIIAKVVFWITYLIFMVTVVTREIISNTVIQWELTWVLWASGGLMFFAFCLLELSSMPKPKIKPERLYTVEKVISHNYRDHTAVLNHDGNIELFRCRYVNNLGSLKFDKQYTVQKIDGDLFFTPK